jgi:hypothetical protein
MLRTAAGWFEIANVELRLRGAHFSEPAFELGGLATAWNRLASARSSRELHERLAATAWGRPDDDSLRTVGLTMRTRLLFRASKHMPECRQLIVGAAALMLARERLAIGADFSPRVRHDLEALLGQRCVAANSLGELQNGLPVSARWALTDIGTVDDLWRAERRWWSRLEADGLSFLRASRFGPEQLIGAVAVMAADAWKVRGALEIATRHGRGREDFDALA